MCFGQAVDPALLNLVNSNITDLYEFVKRWTVEIDDEKVPCLYYNYKFSLILLLSQILYLHCSGVAVR